MLNENSIEITIIAKMSNTFSFIDFVRRWIYVRIYKYWIYILILKKWNVIVTSCHLLHMVFTCRSWFDIREPVTLMRIFI